jgi:hypothetical protein
MCQNWFSMLGLLFDVTGFLLLSKEWYWAMRLQGGDKVREIGDIGELSDFIVGQTLDLFFQPERGVLPRHAEIED